MEYPNLLLAIRASGQPQYRVARAADLRESRLSEIIRRGGATDAERVALGRALGVVPGKLFGSAARSATVGRRLGAD